MSDRTPHLDALLTELKRTKRRRRQRGVATVVGAFALGLTLWLWPASPASPGPTPPPQAQKSSAPAQDGTGAPIEVPAPVQDAVASSDDRTPAPLIVVSSRTTPSSVERIDDDTLLRLLNTDGRRTGLIQRDGETTLDAQWLSLAE